MKKLLFAVVLILIFACSKDDSNSKISISKYKIQLYDDCDSGYPALGTIICVSKSEYDKSYDGRNDGPCEIKTIVDIDGVTHQGVAGGWFYSLEGFDCDGNYPT